jgi:nuclease-like protein
MEASGRSKRLRLRRADRCLACERELAAGDEAIWHLDIRRVTCVGCHVADTAVVEGQAGGSALREYDRRHRRREQHARERLGGLGALLARVTDEPTSTKVWRQGANGEVRSAARLAKHLGGTAVRLLHDRRIPGHGQANIDHVAVGPGGVTVIDTKTHRGEVRVDRIGGLFAPRRDILLIKGRDQTRLIDGVERQLEYVCSALRDLGHSDVMLRGALCFPNVEGLPMFRQLSVRDIVIDGPKPVSRLAARPGALPTKEIERLWRALACRFPPA